MGNQTEALDGFVIDVACIRKNAREHLLERASTHSRECALMGHCIESGYGIVSPDGDLTVLDPDATRMVVDVVEGSDTQEGIRLHVTREHRDGTMVTTTVEER